MSSFGNHSAILSRKGCILNHVSHFFPKERFCVVCWVVNSGEHSELRNQLSLDLINGRRRLGGACEHKASFL